MEKIRNEDAYQNRKCIRGLYQASGRPAENLGGSHVDWLIKVAAVSLKVKRFGGKKSRKVMSSVCAMVI